MNRRTAVFLVAAENGMNRASTMTFDFTASASGSDLPRPLPWLTPLLRIVFLSAVITGFGGFPPPHGEVVLFAQQVDNRDQNLYANAHPYLEEPVNKLVKRIPELKRLRPEEGQQALTPDLSVIGN